MINIQNICFSHIWYKMPARCHVIALQDDISVKTVPSDCITLYKFTEAECRVPASATSQSYCGWLYVTTRAVQSLNIIICMNMLYFRLTDKQTDKSGDRDTGGTTCKCWFPGRFCTFSLRIRSHFPNNKNNIKSAQTRKFTKLLYPNMQLFIKKIVKFFSKK